MAEDPRPPTGLGRRRQRLSDEETAQRMLRAATAMVHRTGLTVSLEHLSLEDVIREAGVARSAVYRRWPYKDLFLGDLLKELARATELATVADTDSRAMVARVAANHLDWLETPALRRRLMAELVRVGGSHDFEMLADSPGWRSYVALHATFRSLPEGDLRDDVQAALTVSERGFIRRVARAWARLANLLGYRLRPELGTSFPALAHLATGALCGLALMAPTAPGAATPTVHADPFGTGTAEWSPAALALASIAFTFLEEDPDVDWDEARITALREALTRPA